MRYEQFFTRIMSSKIGKAFIKWLNLIKIEEVRRNFAINLNMIVFADFSKKDLNQDLGGGTTDKSWGKYFWRTNLQKLIKAVLRIFKVRRKSDNISHLTLSWTTPTKPMITCYLQVMRVWGALRSSAYSKWLDSIKLTFKENW